MRASRNWLLFTASAALFLTAGCAEENATPAEQPAPQMVEAPAFSVEGWTQAPAEQPADYEGPDWAMYSAGRQVQGDFNGDGAVDTAVLLERAPSDEALEQMYGDRAQAVKPMIREFGLFVFFSSDATPVMATSRIGGTGQYGLDLRAGDGSGADSIDFIKYDSSNSLYVWNPDAGSFDEIAEGD